QQLVPVDIERLFQRLDDIFRQCFDIGGVPEVVDDQGELVTTDAGEHGFVDVQRAQALCCEKQQLVADLVTERIVDRPEAIQVEAHQRDALTIQACQRQRLVQFFTE